MITCFRWIDRNPEQENRFIPGGVILCIGALACFSVKQYPMDYQDGKLLGPQWGAMAQNRIIFLYILCGWPLVMKKCSCHDEIPA